MRILAALLSSLLIAAAQPAGDLLRSSLGPKDLGKYAKDLAAYFDSLVVQDLDSQQKSLDAIEKEMKAAGKRAKLDDPLKYVGDWDLALELAKPEDRVLKGHYGKGFFRHVYVSVGDPSPKKKDDDITVACLLSLPSGYGKDDALLPVIVGLKPRLELKGEPLETKVLEMATTIYADVLESAIVLIPLGQEAGVGRDRATTEPEGSWMAPDGLLSFSLSLNILLEQLRFDRARVVLDGWADAGLDAMMLSTNLPSWFAGVINRSGEPGDERVIYDNLRGVPVLYVSGAAEGRKLDVEALKARKPDLTVLDESGSSLAPSAETRGAIGTWINERKRDLAPDTIDHRIGNIDFQFVDWIQVSDPRLRANAKPGDADFPHIKAQIDRAQNKITIETVNILELRLFLSDALVDLDKRVVLEVNGKTVFDRQCRRDLRAMLENRFYSNAYAGIYTFDEVIAEIDPNVPAAAGQPK
jgi:hypothetical protein